MIDLTIYNNNIYYLKEAKGKKNVSPHLRLLLIDDMIILCNFTLKSLKKTHVFFQFFFLIL